MSYMLAMHGNAHHMPAGNGHYLQAAVCVLLQCVHSFSKNKIHVYVQCVWANIGGTEKTWFYVIAPFEHAHCRTLTGIMLYSTCL